MPRPQSRLASNISGFVCKSCLAKLRSPQQTQWLSRGIANRTRHKGQEPREAKASQVVDSEPAFRFYEQTPDGRRTEIHDDGDFLGLRGRDPLAKKVEESLFEIEDAEKGDPKVGLMSRLMNIIKPANSGIEQTAESLEVEDLFDDVDETTVGSMYIYTSVYHY